MRQEFQVHILGELFSDFLNKVEALLVPANQKTEA